MPIPRPRRPDALVLVVVAALTLLGMVGLVGARVLGAPDDRVPPGVRIGGVPVGGLTPALAERVVLANAARPPRAVRVLAPGRPGFPLAVPVAELAPRPRIRAAVRAAMQPRSVGARILREIGLGRDRDVPLRYRLSRPAVAARVARIAARIDRPSRSAALAVSGGRIRLTAAAPGRRVDREELARRLARLPLRLVVPVTTVPPAITTAAAEGARRRAARATARARTVTAAGRSASIGRDVLLRALRFAPRGAGIGVSLDAGVLAQAVAPTFAPILAEPRDAAFEVRGRRVSVVPSRDGRRLDTERLATTLLRRPGARTVMASITALPPERTTADARAMRIEELVSEFSTPYACCQPRVVNITRAAEILDGYVIPAGGTFSLNEALGERTTARGFVPAPQINAGRLEDAVGGGVSQMATTIFNAAFFAGLRIVTHTPHEFWISRYPAGREATVSWGGPELIVENDWPAAVLLKVSATDTSLTVRMYSARLGRRVTTETIGTPVEGAAFPIEYTRRVLRGREVVRDERFTWSYRAPPPS